MQKGNAMQKLFETIGENQERILTMPYGYLSVLCVILGGANATLGLLEPAAAVMLASLTLSMACIVQGRLTIREANLAHRMTPVSEQDMDDFEFCLWLEGRFDRTTNEMRAITLFCGALTIALSAASLLH